MSGVTEYKAGATGIPYHWLLEEWRASKHKGKRPNIWFPHFQQTKRKYFKLKLNIDPRHAKSGHKSCKGPKLFAPTCVLRGSGQQNSCVHCSCLYCIEHCTNAQMHTEKYSWMSIPLHSGINCGLCTAINKSKKQRRPKFSDCTQLSRLLPVFAQEATFRGNKSENLSHTKNKSNFQWQIADLTFDTVWANYTW